MSLETLSAARGPRPRPTPALRWGRGKQLGNRSGLPGDPGPPLPAPPRGRPGPRQGPRRPRGPPARTPTGSSLALRPFGAPALHPSPAQGPDHRERHTPPARLPAPRASHGPSSQRSPSSPLLRPRRYPSSSSGARPRGARPDRVTRADGTARISPCPPSPRARRGRARQEPRRDAPVSSRASAVPSTCSPGKVGAPEERRRGLQSGRNPHSKPGGTREAPPSRVLVPNSGGGKEVRSAPSIQMRRRSRKPEIVHVDL